MSAPFEHRLWIDGKREESSSKKTVFSPWDSRKVAEVFQADSAQLHHAIHCSVRAFEEYRRSSAFLRSKLLAAMAAGISAHRADLVSLIVHEAGKPRMLADIEVTRAIMTFTIASEECKRHGGELLPVD